MWLKDNATTRRRGRSLRYTNHYATPKIMAHIQDKVQAVAVCESKQDVVRLVVAIEYLIPF